MKPSVQFSLAALVAALALAAAGALLWFQPEPDVEAPERPVATVEAVEATPTDERLVVRSQGNATPRTATELSAEVGGRVIDVSPNFRVGRFFEKGETLLRIDPRDHRAAVAARKADVAAAELALAREEARAEQARLDWRSIDEGKGEASPLTLREPHLREARAALESARASLRQAKRNLDRASVEAPYDGRVLEKSAALGQVVRGAGGAPLGTIYAADVAEVRLPVSNREANLIDLPEMGAERDRIADPPTVELTGDLGGHTVTWTGEIARVDATIDPRDRLLNLIAEIDQGFAPRGRTGRPPLQRGLFLKAEIMGRELRDVFVLPRRALRADGQMYRIRDDNALEAVEVSVAQSTERRVIVDGGLAPGDRVVTSPIAYFVEGMPVNVSESPPANGND